MKQKMKVINLKEKSRDDLVQLFALKLAENMELRKVIKEVREYIENPRHEMSVNTYQGLLEILDKVEENK